MARSLDPSRNRERVEIVVLPIEIRDGGVARPACCIA